MFTGIIESVGKVKSMQPIGGDIRLTIESDELDFSDVKLGDSIASNGICLTVVDFGSNHYSVDVSRETIARTALNALKAGHIVNLEKAMLPTTRFGGHIVAGHVDGVGVVSSYSKMHALSILKLRYRKSWRIIRRPKALSRLMVLA